MIRRIFKALTTPETTPNIHSKSYKDWWTFAGSTHELAMATTIGNITEEDYRSRGWNGDGNSFGARQFLEICNLDKSSRVLEIGCGIARIGREFAPHVAEWHGADISPSMLAHASQRCEHLANVHFHELSSVHDIEKLPSEHYDLVYSTVVLMHLDKEDALHYMRQAFRMLKVGGRAYFDSWNILHPDVFRIWNGSAVVGDGKPRGRVQCLTPGELCVYLLDAGFRVDRLDEQERLARAFATKLTPEPEPLTDDGFPPFGYLVTPTNQTKVSGEIIIEGFALDNVTLVQLLVNGQPVSAPVERGQWNEEVPVAFPRYMTHNPKSGFRLPWDSRTVANGPVEIAIECTDNSGAKTRITGEHHGFVVEN